ncbi:hypothetical protein E2562_034987 [Oryza meyeriana var. granulata]|uniref:Uncharacterized protein n=1 Tax=Oryza meyeriana var. granulata TaxID=110450 RepID=A0A6G1CAU6_9ORYZ|nr:hypothetical protein E2562_034987 [Oryza meyeriana var. granulata]
MSRRGHLRDPVLPVSPVFPSVTPSSSHLSRSAASRFIAVVATSLIVLHSLSHALLVRLECVEAQTELDQLGEGAAEAHKGLVAVALLVVTLGILPALVPVAE